MFWLESLERWLFDLFRRMPPGSRQAQFEIDQLRLCYTEAARTPLTAVEACSWWLLVWFSFGMAEPPFRAKGRRP